MLLKSFGEHCSLSFKKASRLLLSGPSKFDIYLKYNIQTSKYLAYKHHLHETCKIFQFDLLPSLSTQTLVYLTVAHQEQRTYLTTLKEGKYWDYYRKLSNSS